MNCTGKYRPYPQIHLDERKWTSAAITKAPVWCSVDLRDGNQALINPMGIETKLKFFELLVEIGFKEIEVGFPAASSTEYDFIRRLINEKRIPDDVTIQVLCIEKEELIRKTLECVKGAPHVIFHMYNATSPNHRKYVFGKEKDEIIRMAVEGIRSLKRNLSDADYDRIWLEYSPECFSMTEIDFSVEICGAVVTEWNGNRGDRPPVIINLPSTVECSTPNVFADQVEYFCTHIPAREKIILSIHNHNDRGEGVASCELGLLAGADRVEGCLFGNGERTGNLDIVTVALNMYSQGIDPCLDFHDLPKICKLYSEYTGMQIPMRTPYAGELVFTAFSGTHQDAIRKGMNARTEMKSDSLWDVPYLLIDPHDIGRQYEGIIRINSQSGKGGAAFILEHEYGIVCPKKMHPVLGKLVNEYADEKQKELHPEEILSLFEEKWLNKKTPLCVLDLATTHLDGTNDNEGQTLVRAVIKYRDNKFTIGDKGNGPLNAFANALSSGSDVPDFNIIDFHEHSIGTGTNTAAMAYVQIKTDIGEFWGVGKSTNVSRAGIDAIVSALNQISE